MIFSSEKKSASKTAFFALIFSVFAACFSFPADFPIPRLSGRVVDKADVIDGRTQDKIEDFLKSVEDSSGIQIAVLTVPSVPVSIEEYAFEVFNQWKLGEAKKDNGVLLVVAVNDRTLKIETGYGLEGTLTDTKCGIIIREAITPRFKDGDYAEGIFDGVRFIAGYASGDREIVDRVDSADNEDDEGFPPLPLILWLLFIAFIIIMNIKGGGGRSGRGGPPVFFTGGGGFSSGGFSGGGGGFSGGGGRSGGGGASGHW